MKRRDVLKILVALLASVGSPSGHAATVPKKRRAPRVRPSDPGWPSPQRWGQLKEAVGGRLIPVEPLFGACALDPKGAACAGVTKHMKNPFHLRDQPGATQVSGWLDAWTPAPSAYAVVAHGAADVAAAVNFAREHNLRVAIKGVGHSYLGTSNAPDSLLIWTRHMDQVTLHDAFVPHGCSGAPVPAVSTGAGATWSDLYDAVTTRGGRYVQGGGCTSVGVAGLVQSGGFGSCSKGWGTAASNLLEAEVVTADGEVRIANRCSHPDLFWALKGGGGGTFGVVTRLTLRTHDLPEWFGYVGGEIQAKSDAAYRRLIARFVAFYREQLFNAHWGEQAGFDGDNVLALSMVCQGIDEKSLGRLWAPFFDWVRASGDYTMSEFIVGSRPARHWWDARRMTSLERDPRPGVPEHHAWWDGDQDQVGAYVYAYESLWLPASLLDEKEQPRLVEAMFAASRLNDFSLHFNKGIAGAAAEAVARTRDTATNPAVLDAFALVILGDDGDPAYPGLPRRAIDVAGAREERRLVDRTTAMLAKVAPAGGSYVSESNYFNARWQQDYWGGNYARLRAIKGKYDPYGLLFVHHGVGSEDWSPDGFTPLNA